MRGLHCFCCSLSLYYYLLLLLLLFVWHFLIIIHHSSLISFLCNELPWIGASLESRVITCSKPPFFIGLWWFWCVGSLSELSAEHFFLSNIMDTLEFSQQTVSVLDAQPSEDWRGCRYVSMQWWTCQNFTIDTQNKSEQWDRTTATSLARECHSLRVYANLCVRSCAATSECRKVRRQLQSNLI